MINIFVVIFVTSTYYVCGIGYYLCVFTYFTFTYLTPFCWYENVSKELWFVPFHTKIYVLPMLPNSTVSHFLCCKLIVCYVAIGVVAKVQMDLQTNPDCTFSRPTLLRSLFTVGLLCKNFDFDSENFGEKKVLFHLFAVMHTVSFIYTEKLQYFLYCTL